MMQIFIHGFVAAAKGEAVSAMVTNQTPTQTPWWQPQAPRPGHWQHYQLGFLSLYLQRLEQDWYLAWALEQGTGSVQEDMSRPWLTQNLSSLPEGLVPSRYSFAEAPTELLLKPRLLDRPVVFKTHQPVHVPPGEKVTFYISSPVCVSLELGKPAMTLLELPSQRLSDTWFGPSTREGELCYGAKTRARNSLEDLPLRPHRAVTPVTIHNRAEDILAIDKLSIPVPLLAVYADAKNNLWTQSVQLEHAQGESFSALTIGTAPPGLKHLAPARELGQTGKLVRAFTRLFSN